MINYTMNKSNKSNDVEKKSTLAKLLATENVEVQENAVSTASFDVKNRILTIPIFKKEHKSKNVYDMLVGHEVAHALWTPADSWGDMKDRKQEFRSFVNVLEDCRIDKKIQKRYPGLQNDYLKGFDKLYKDNFFKTKGRKLDDYMIIDKINLYFKSTKRLKMNLDKKEKMFINMVDKLETFDDVLKLAEEILGYSKDKIKKIPDFDKHATAKIYTKPKPEDKEGEGNSEDNKSEEKSEDNKSTDDKLKEFLDKKEKELGSGSSDLKKAIDAKKEEDKKEVDGFSSGAGGDFDLSSATAREYQDEIQKQLNDNDASERSYFLLNKPNLKNLIVPYKKYIKDNMIKDAVDHIKREDWRSSIDYHRTFYKKFMKESQSTVNYLVKEFEMKKNARLHARAATAKTGVIDPLQLYKYKFAEDIFKKITIIPNEKNHGMIMLLDWSGSMSNHIYPTVEQLLNLVMFARKIQIPFSVYKFCNASRFSDKYDNIIKDLPFTFGPKELQLDKSTRLVQLFTHRQSKKDFLKSGEFLHRAATYFGLHYGYRRSCGISEADYSKLYHVPSPLNEYSLHSTPLDESLIAMDTIIAKFKHDYQSDKISLITLTDGQSNGISATGNKWVKLGKNYVDCSGYGSCYDKEHKDLTHRLLKYLKKKHGIKTIGFFLVKKFRDLRYHVQYKYDKELLARKMFNKDKCIPDINTGYDVYFYIKSDTQIANNKMQDINTTNKRILKKEFVNSMKKRLVSRVLLQKFIKEVA